MDRPDLDAPDSEWLVYADALQVAGDARGELISLVHGADAAARDTYVHKHATALLGPAAKAFRKHAYRLTWRHCFIETAEVLVGNGELREHEVGALLAAPAASELCAIAIVGVTDRDKPALLTKAIDALAKSPLPASCKSLAIVDERATRARTMIARDYNVDDNLVTFRSLDPIWKLPIEHLRLELADCEHLNFGAIDGSRLKSFTLRALRTLRETVYRPSQLAQALGASAWDRMEDFELRLAETFVANIPLERAPYVADYSHGEAERYDEAEDGDDEGVDYAALAPLFAKLAKAPLRRLALTSFVSAESLIATLRASGLAPTLRVLDLSDSVIDPDLLRDPLFANVTLVTERTAPAIGDAPTYRFVVGME